MASASLITILGKGFPRLRIGIGRPPGGADPVGFVLEPFAASELSTLQEVIERASDGVESWVQNGLEPDDERPQSARWRTLLRLAIHEALR
jgi:PTH1 family peptidyl-tRNA hydrolase